MPPLWRILSGRLVCFGLQALVDTLKNRPHTAPLPLLWWLEPQRAADVRSLAPCLPANKRGMPPGPRYFHGVAILQTSPQVYWGTQLHDVVRSSSDRAAPLLRIHVLDSPQ